MDSKRIEAYRNRVPVLVNHHNAQEDAECEEEQSINVVLDCVADGYAESEKEDLAACEESGAEHDVTDGPPVFQRAEDQDELGDNVDWHADDRPNDVDDKEGHGFCVVEAE